MLKKTIHYLFECPTFWEIRPRFKCPDCGAKYRCYWDGNDCCCGKINLCNSCASTTHKNHTILAAERE